RGVSPASSGGPSGKSRTSAPALGPVARSVVPPLAALPGLPAARRGGVRGGVRPALLIRLRFRARSWAQTLDRRAADFKHLFEKVGPTHRLCRWHGVEIRSY